MLWAASCLSSTLTHQGQHPGAGRRHTAKIYLGKIKKWNDAAIVKLNPTLKLPSNAISVNRPLDGSGTTFNFTYYLSAVSSDWKNDVARIRR